MFDFISIDNILKLVNEVRGIISFKSPPRDLNPVGYSARDFEIILV